MAEPRSTWRRGRLGTVLSLRHFESDRGMRDAMAATSLSLPNVPGELTGSGPWLAWRSPTETWLLEAGARASADLLARFAPGASPTAMAVDISDALVCFEIMGNDIPHGVPRLVDASAAPTSPGRASCCRLGDAAVMLLQVDERRLWILVERPLSDHVEEWLDYVCGSVPNPGVDAVKTFEPELRDPDA